MVGGSFGRRSMVGYFLGKLSVVGGRCHCVRWSVICGREAEIYHTLRFATK